MMILEVFGYTLIPIAAMVFSGTGAAYRKPGPKVRSGMLHLAAGVIFAVVALEFLPKLVRASDPLATVGGFAIGTAAMLAIRSVMNRQESRSEGRGERAQSLPVVLLVATGVDIAIDGLMLGIAFATGKKEGFLLTVALSIEFVSLGLAIAAALKKYGVQRARAVLTVSGLSLIFGVSAIVVALVLQNLSGRALAAVLAFGSAALLFLVTEELLTEAHEFPETPLLTAAFFFGFIALFLLDMLMVR